MKAAKLTQQQAYELVAEIPPGTPLISAIKQKWDVVVITNDCKQLSGRFRKSLDKNVDDQQKKGAILRCLSELYAASCDENFQGAIDESGLECKVAHRFEFEKVTHKLMELKPNKKDRLYFYLLKDGGPAGRKLIFLLMAFHKKDQKTPDEVTGPCEEEIKSILRSRGNIEICEDKNVAKK